MSRSQKIVLFGFLLMLAALVYVEATKPQPINWFPSYFKADKIPLGTFVLHNLMEDSFKERFKEVDLPPFEFLQQAGLNGTYVFINDELAFDKTELDSLFNWASKGNNVFISANYLNEKLLDTFNLKMATQVSISKISTEPLVQLTNKSIASGKTFHIKKDFNVRYFSKIDTVSHTVLGVSGIYVNSDKIDKPQVNFIKVPMEKGNVFLHTQPEVFSNFFLLSGANADYTSALVSYLNDGKTLYWDNYYKSGKHINISPMRVLLNNKYFKWAYHFVLFGVLLFIIFEGKRKQRSIPIIKPLTNKTYEYTKTIAGMYLDKNEYHAIAQKQIVLFLEYIRTKLRLPTEHLNDRFYKTVAERSGNTIENTVALFTLIEKINTQNNTTKEELIKLYERIKSFK
ncbi:DUF4350 domain-containing protein [Aequorivita viscosa]|uniref:DUF4350 domain-containing protein n=1 Tax=Aequorivita viscosa TaxID=797419 RepID=A0A1M6GLR3_9FLAO|nr:DUF4350 domain-containing protein [Aequorivita viscosa]SDX58562.1 protein of unknown function [Aequorivita viscosa]SHJ10878.1 protein of unknown function [Aequorivita viscosa]